MQAFQVICEHLADAPLGEHWQGRLGKAAATTSRWSVFLQKPEYEKCLGWVDSPQRALADYPALRSRCDALLAEHLENIVLLGMGGSTATTMALSDLYGSATRRRLIVIDSTNPDTIARLSATIPPERSLFIVASKSGTTMETLTLFHYFFGRCCEALSVQQAGRHFIAITDPGTPLAALAERYGFAAVFLSEPKVGGRFSAFTPFGIVPMMLAGIDLAPLLADAAQACQGTEKNELLATADSLAETICLLVLPAGYGKIIISTKARLRGVALWLEQLLAESTGKDGKGILPIIIDDIADNASCGNNASGVGEAAGGVISNNNIGKDIVIALRWQTDKKTAGEDKARNATDIADYAKDCVRARAGKAGWIINNEFGAPAGAGRCFYLWMLLVSALGERLAINPFNQPDVEMAKIYTQELLKTGKTKTLPEPHIINISPESLPAALIELRNFLENMPVEADYIALILGLDTNDANNDASRRLCDSIRRFSRRDVTMNIAPRYLHSTGQLHKGGADKGVFIIIQQQPYQEITFAEMTFAGAGKIGSLASLLEAQLAADAAALTEYGRRVLRLKLEAADAEKTASLLDALAAGVASPQGG